MRIPVAASLLLSLGFVCAADGMSVPAFTEDLEGSGSNIDGSGSGDWSGQGEINVKDQPDSFDAGGGTKNTVDDSSDLTFDRTQWNLKNGVSGYVVLANSRSFLENKEITAGVVAGGAIGLTVAVVLGALLIYKWQKKDDGYILGQQTDSADREVVVV